jgi:hypothetical protein
VIPLRYGLTTQCICVFHTVLTVNSINRLDSVAETYVSPVRYELGFYVPEDGILHSHCREDLRCDKLVPVPTQTSFHEGICSLIIRLS